MYWNTLSVWLWIVYYLFLLIMFSSTIFSIIRKRMVAYSMVALLITITLPMVGVINSIDRPIEQSEWDHLLTQLKQGALWAFYSIAGHAYLVSWLAVFLWNLKISSKKTSTQL
jgi:hypothetical protein